MCGPSKNMRGKGRDEIGKEIDDNEWTDKQEMNSQTGDEKKKERRKGQTIKRIHRKQRNGLRNQIRKRKTERELYTEGKKNKEKIIQNERKICAGDRVSSLACYLIFLPCLMLKWRRKKQKTDQRFQIQSSSESFESINW